MWAVCWCGDFTVWISTVLFLSAVWLILLHLYEFSPSKLAFSSSSFLPQSELVILNWHRCDSNVSMDTFLYQNIKVHFCHWGCRILLAKLPKKKVRTNYTHFQCMKCIYFFILLGYSLKDKAFGTFWDHTCMLICRNLGVWTCREQTPLQLLKNNHF